MKEENQKKGPYNPLDKVNLGRSVAGAIIQQPYSILPPESFKGVGIYAIYYFGDHPAYNFISDYNNSHESGWPVYVGKAIPSGGRKGNFSSENVSRNLYNRLVKHARTIESVSDLHLGDFRCKYLTIDSIWIPLGEQLIIRKYQPVWNSIIDGFGNNDPGKERYSGRIPDWHRLHQGVDWVSKMDGSLEQVSIEPLLEKIRVYQVEQLKVLNKT